MKTVLDFLTSPAAAAIILAIIGELWRRIQASEAYKNKLNNDWRVCIEALEAAAVNTYVKFVEGRKADPKDGPPGQLSASAADAARKDAIDQAQAIAAKRGVDLHATLGPGNVTAYLETAVARAKAEGLTP